MAAVRSPSAFLALALVLNPRAALLSNYEVLQLLRELEADHIARTRTAQRLKKEEEDVAAATGHPPPPSPDPPLTVSENLRTIEVEAIQYLTADYQPTRLQTAQGIRRLTENLAPFDLTKAEKLQVVNLIPVEPVELYVIVEELEDRLGNCMEDVLSVVRSSLTAPPPSSSPATTGGTELPLPAAPPPLEIVDETPARAHDDMDLDAPLWEHDVDEVEYVDAGEGIGIEGDLDVEDDE
ncbi:HRDC-like protein [Russula compacta]|nr:HRDC-like protein [Russula compacta]